MNVLENLLYTKEHEWVKIEGKLATVGITDYAQGSLGDITFVELPKAGDKAAQGKQFATVESIKAASDVYAPLSGKIVKVNTALANSPQFVNQSPYLEGWFTVIEIENEKEKQGLLSSADYKKYLEGLSK
jgi:glycine cleavage system H protein